MAKLNRKDEQWAKYRESNESKRKRRKVGRKKIELNITTKEIHVHKEKIFKNEAKDEAEQHTTTERRRKKNQ